MKNSILLQGKAYTSDWSIPKKILAQYKYINVYRGRSVNDSVKGCVYEFTTLMNCLGEHQYDNKLCPTESLNFRKCYEDYLKSEDEKRENNKANLRPYTQKYSSTQINMYLKKFRNK